HRRWKSEVISTDHSAGSDRNRNSQPGDFFLKLVLNGNHATHRCKFFPAFERRDDAGFGTAARRTPAWVATRRDSGGAVRQPGNLRPRAPQNLRTMLGIPRA